MVQLIKTTEEYRADTEEEAQNLIDKTKTEQGSGGFNLIGFGSTVKTKKMKGEIVDSWYIVKLTKQYSSGIKE